MGLNVWDESGKLSCCLKYRTGLRLEALTDKLQTYGIAVRPAFGLDRHVRVSVGLPEANEHFVVAMEKILQ